MRVLLINAAGRRNEFNAKPLPPLGLGYLAAYLRKYCAITEIWIVPRSLDVDTGDAVRAFQPDLVGLSSTTQEFQAAIEVADQVKAVADVPVVVGGHHITALPQSLSPAMDIAVMGEGEETLRELVEIHELCGLGPAALRAVKGIAYWDDGQIAVNERRERIADIDLIPPPARDLMPVTGQTTHLMTSRGCPYRCTYCSAGSFWKSVRFFSPDRVVDEIEEVIERYGARDICIEDDLFIAKKRRVEEIARRVVERGLHRRARFSCLCRANLLTEDIAKTLRSMNVWHVAMGLESGSEAVLSGIKQGSVTVKQGQKAIRILKKYGFAVRGFFMIGAPGERVRDLQRTLRFVMNSGLDSGRISVMVPLPGTAIWEQAKQQGLVSDDMDWDRFDMDFENCAERYLLVNDQVDRGTLRRYYWKIKNRLAQYESGELALRDVLRLQTLVRGAKQPVRTSRTVARLLYKSMLNLGLTALGDQQAPHEPIAERAA